MKALLMTLAVAATLTITACSGSNEQATESTDSMTTDTMTTDTATMSTDTTTMSTDQLSTDSAGTVNQ